MSLLAGAARTDITTYEEGIQLFGWGMPWNVARGVATPLRARALVLSSDGRHVALVLCDLGIITLAIRRRALELLRDHHPDCSIDSDSLMLSATHTHSGPSGYCEYLFYTFSGPGYSSSTVEVIATGIADAVAAAWKKREPAQLAVVQGDMAQTETVAFNRAIRPFRANPEVGDEGASSPEDATDRTMTLLRVDSTERRAPIAIMNWFATHSTTVHSDNDLIHCDHKGLAADDLERQLRDELGVDAVALFAQEAAGDITPNYRYDKKRKVLVGRGDTDHESAQYVADAQRRLAYSLFRRAGDTLRDDAALSSVLRYVKLDQVTPAPEFTGGREVQTSEAVLGIGMLEGTREGPGPLLRARPALRRLTNARCKRGEICDPKVPFLETGRGRKGRAFGLLTVERPLLPDGVDHTVKMFRRYKAADALGDEPWTPTVLPFQVLRIGTLAIATIPAEPTTVAGRRVRALLRGSLAKEGVEHTICAGYTNDYASYVTTEHEYQLQYYEGSSTLFGPWTLAASLSALQDCIRAMRSETGLWFTEAEPPVFDREMLERRAFRVKDA